MELRKFYGKSNRVYFVTWSEETHWHVFVETALGFVPAVAKTAALYCGAIDGCRRGVGRN